MSLNVLWVEDEPNSLSSEVEIAREHGWNITWAETVSKGLELARSTVFDLVIVDLILPPSEYERQRGYVDPDAGLTLIESIREPSRRGRTMPTVPILVITAVVTERLKAKVLGKLESGRYYLTKPLEIELYEDIVRDLSQRLASSARRHSQRDPSNAN
jgi:two-component system OmpR family response regulator